MPQTSRVQEPMLAVLKWQVVEAHPVTDAWVIAGFDTEEDARAFAALKQRSDRTRSTFTVRESPEWTAIQREAEAFRLRRRAEVTLELAGRDA